MDVLDHACARLSRRRRCQGVVNRLLPAAGISAAIAAAGVAVVRLAVPDSGWLVPGLTALGVLAPCALLPTALRHQDPDWLIAGHVDRLTHADGLAMALAQGPRPAAWLESLAPRLRSLRPPKLRAPALLATCAAWALLGGACLLPQAHREPDLPPLIGGLLRRAESQVASAQEQQLVPPEELSAWEQRLAEIREHAAKSGLDQQTWAALDALGRDLDQARADAAQRLSDALQKAGDLGALAGGADNSAAAQAAADLAASLANLAEKNPGLALQLPAGADQAALLRLAAQAAAGGKLSEEQVALLKRWGLNPAQGGQGGAADAAGAAALAERLRQELAQHAANTGLSPARNPGGPGAPGQDGLGGHPEMSWGEKLRVDGGSRQRLAGGEVLDTQAAEVVGVQARAPGSEEQGVEHGGNQGGGFDPTAANAARAQVAPRHRSAVAAYFASTPSAQPPAPSTQRPGPILP